MRVAGTGLRSGEEGGAAVTRLVRSLGGLVLASSVGCGGAEEGAKSPPADTPAPAAKSPAAEAPVREMKPAEKAADAKHADEPPELVAPAGAKDERPDAANPK
jgi:hypothetical protein